MFDLEIQNLRLTVRNAQGHEHRIASIAERAMALVAERADDRWRSSAASAQQPSAVHLDLGTIGDEQAARMIADVCLSVLALKLSV